MKKQISVYLLVLALLLACFAGCGQPSSTAAASAISADMESAAPVTASPEEPAEPTPAVEAEPPENEETVSEAPEEIPSYTLPLTEEDVTFTVFSSVSPMISALIESPADIVAWKKIMEDTGVTLEFKTCSPDVEFDQIQLMILNGDYTDIIPRIDTTYAGGAAQALEDGVIVDLIDYVFDNCPNYVALLEENELMDYVVTSTGAMGGFVQISNNSYLHSTGLVIRQDMLDTLGMEKPQTYNELHDVMSRMKNELDVASPLWLPSTGYLMNDYLVDGFGTSSQSLFVVDGQIQYGPASDGMRDYYELINSWYTEGLIYPDFFSGDGSDSCKDYDRIAADEITVFPTGAVDLGNYAAYSSNPDFRVVAQPDVSQNAGDVIYATSGPALASECINIWSITTNCEDVPLLCRFVDYMFTEEGSLTANYGVEGDTYTYDENGQPIFTDKIQGKEGLDYVQSLLTSVLDNAPFMVDWYRGTNAYTEDMMESYEIWSGANYDFSHVLPMDFSLSAEEMTEYFNKISDVETYVEEMSVKFILGNEPLSEWNAYVSKLEEMGLQDALAIYQAAYDNYLNK